MANNCFYTMTAVSKSKKFIAVCNYSYDGESYSSRVKGKRGKKTFTSLEEANEAVKADMKEYAESEKDAGRNVKIVSNHIEWLDSWCKGEYEASWTVYEA